MAISWRPPAGPCLWPVPNINLCLVKARRMIRHSPVIYDRVSYNIVIDVTSYCLCHVLLVRSKSQIVPTLRDGDYTRVWITEGHVRVCPPFSLSLHLSSLYLYSKTSHKSCPCLSKGTSTYTLFLVWGGVEVLLSFWSKWLIKEFLMNKDKSLTIKRILKNMNFSLSQEHHTVWYIVGA